MNNQVLLVCDGTPTVTAQNTLSCPNWLTEPHNQSLADALTIHATALDANTEAMSSFFTLSAEDVGLISALMIATFITGNAIGKVASIMRKA